MLSKKQINTIESRNQDITELLKHNKELESILTDLDYEDVFGTEGWRRHFGVEEE